MEKDPLRTTAERLEMHMTANLGALETIIQQQKDRIEYLQKQLDHRDQLLRELLDEFGPRSGS